SVSAGQQGFSALVDTVHDGNYGDTYQFNEATGALTWLASNVQLITAGTDQYGNHMFEMLTYTGDWSEYRVGSGWKYLWTYTESLPLWPVPGVNFMKG